jgi:hypothetical protein
MVARLGAGNHILIERTYGSRFVGEADGHPPPGFL